MDFKTFWKSTTAFVLKNVIIAAILIVLLIVCAVKWLSSFTHHGEEVVVPTITGLYVEEAQILAGNEGLTIQVIDSTYSKKAPLGTIVEQNPRAESNAKRGRTVYVIVNAKTARQVPVPDLRDVSCRQAEATLKAIGLEVEGIEYEPSEYKDLVLDLKFNGEHIEPGKRINEGSLLTLVVGFGRGTENVEVPNLTGKNIADIRATLLSNRLILGSITYDTELTEENKNCFVAYSQSVSAGSLLLEGSRIDVQMTTDLQKAATASAQLSEEDFF